MKVDFITFCHAGDGHRLHKPGQLRKQVESNGYRFNIVHVIHQQCNPADFDNPDFCDFTYTSLDIVTFDSVNQVLSDWNIKLTGQYTSATDQAHHWKYHVANHLVGIEATNADFIVFADNDCWMVRQPPGKSWIDRGIDLLSRQDCFIVSPNDGEPARKTRRMSQQMFMTNVSEFRSADFNQPGWDGNVNIPGGPMPEYWAMLEGRMELHCRTAGKYRYVLGPEYRYWHFNRLNEEGHFETDTSKY